MEWRFNLLRDMEDPTKIIYSDDWITVLEDRFPKAEKHFLVLPLRNISNLTQVKRRDLPLLEYMYYKGRAIADEYGEGREFKFGYHADSLLERLHLHVISEDLNSPSLKTRRHWNNFTTPLFIESFEAIHDLKRLGRVRIPPRAAIERYLQTTPKCPKCGYESENLLDMKNHIFIHRYDNRYRYRYRYR